MLDIRGMDRPTLWRAGVLQALLVAAAALVLTGELARFDERGRLALRIPTPVPYVTCPCIGGASLDTIYLTTLRDTGNLLKTDHPDAGALLAIHGTGVRGLPEVRFATTRRAERGVHEETA